MFVDSENSGYLAEQFRERVLRARQSPPGGKIRDALRLFDLACKFTMNGIRSQFPDATATEAQAILSRRLAIGEMLERTR